MNKEFKESSRFGVDFLDLESGEKIISLVSHSGGARHLPSLIALTNLGSLYKILGESAIRLNPSLKSEEVEDEK